MWRDLAPAILIIALPLSLWARGRMERFVAFHDLRFQLAGGNHALSVDFRGQTVTVQGWVQGGAGRIDIAPTVLNALVVGAGKESRRVAGPVALHSMPGREMVVMKGTLHDLRYYDREGAFYLKGWFETDTGLRVEVFPSLVGGTG